MPVPCGLPKQKMGIKRCMLLKACVLGKKPYIDMSEYANDEGNTVHDQHVIMKGFPTSCIEYYAKETEMSVLYVYKELYDNKSIIIDLTNQTTKCVLEIPQSIMLNHYVMVIKGLRGPANLLDPLNIKLMYQLMY